jgi:fatty acid desaturase
MRAGSDRRVSTHAVHQHLLARFFLVPYNIGFHLAHHVDAGIPFRSLPAFHRHLRDSGFAGSRIEHPSYWALWKALQAG